MTVRQGITSPPKQRLVFRGAGDLKAAAQEESDQTLLGQVWVTEGEELGQARPVCQPGTWPLRGSGLPRRANKETNKSGHLLGPRPQASPVTSSP